MISSYAKRIFSKKEICNASWLIFGRIIQMILSLFVGIITARYLGPDNYGLINYASAFVAFFTSFCTLGLNSVIIKNFVDYPDEEGESIGTAIVLRFVSSVLSAIMIVCIVSIIDKNEPLTIVVSILCSVSLIFQIFDTINFWFQSRYQSKVTSISTLIAYLVVSIYKIVLLFLKKDVTWFAFSNSIDYIVIAVMLLVCYKRNSGPKLSFSYNKARQLLSSSYHYILSSMMVAIYGQTDKLMLKQLLNTTEVGYYAVATVICNMWVFVLQAIIDSIYPTILNLYEKDMAAFERKNKQLYAIVIYFSCFISLIIVLFGGFAIEILYGKEYLSAIAPLKIITWYTAFSFLGVARNAWIVCTNNQKYLKYMYATAVVINILLNYCLIPFMGASGAALASLITQLSTCIILPFFIKDMRPNVKLMLEAVVFKFR